MIILGVDPGLNITGIGFIEAQGGALKLVEASDIRPPRGLPLQERLAYLHEHLAAAIASRRPEVAVLEKVFTHYKHTTTAAKMAHARGAVCLAVQRFGLRLVELAPTRVKHAVTGKGNATKAQVAAMVDRWLGVKNPGWSLDATDALALAITHAHTRVQDDTLAQLQGTHR